MVRTGWVEKWKGEIKEARAAEAMMRRQNKPICHSEYHHLPARFRGDMRRTLRILHG